jgi:hypothetical protein
MSFMFARQNIYLFDLLAGEERRQVFPGDAGPRARGRRNSRIIVDVSNAKIVWGISSSGKMRRDK